MPRSVVLAVVVALAALAVPVRPAGAKLLVYMDLKQTDHLKAYGLAYWVLVRGEKVADHMRAMKKLTRVHAPAVGCA